MEVRFGLLCGDVYSFVFVRVLGYGGYYLFVFVYCCVCKLRILILFVWNLLVI